MNSLLEKGVVLKDSEFEFLAAIIYKNAGIELKSHKKSLLEGRLQRIWREAGIQSFEAYKAYLMESKSKDLLRQRMSDLIDRISTNHTFFYRESIHFEIFEKKILPELIEKNKTTKRLRVWCAASSSGEEPYTLQIIIMKVLGSQYKLWDVGVLATDISSEILQKAVSGKYEKDAVEALPKDYIRIGFDDRGSFYTVKPEVSRGVMFKRFNLINEFPFKSQFDAVFCRNVMIYFDLPTKILLLDKMHRFMVKDGYFFTSLSEFLDWKELKLNKIQAGIYKKLK